MRQRSVPTRRISNPLLPQNRSHRHDTFGSYFVPGDAVFGYEQPDAEELASEPAPLSSAALRAPEPRTHEPLVIEVPGDRRPRNIPFAMLDVKATISANHDRGIDLHVPNDKNEISLSFRKAERLADYRPLA